MNSKSYRWCSVPLCTNTSIKTPNKLFVFVPYEKTIRDKWLRLARRDLTGILPTTQLYFCEDHFDLPSDMENYMQYHVMGVVSQVRMNPGCIPKKFHCQPDRRERESDTTEPQYVLKKQRKMLINKCEKNLGKTTATNMECQETSAGSTDTKNMEKPKQEFQERDYETTGKIKLYESGDFNTKNVIKIKLEIEEDNGPDEVNFSLDKIEQVRAEETVDEKCNYKTFIKHEEVDIKNEDESCSNELNLSVVKIEPVQETVDENYLHETLMEHKEVEIKDEDKSCSTKNRLEVEIDDRIDWTKDDSVINETHKYYKCNACQYKTVKRKYLMMHLRCHKQLEEDDTHKCDYTTVYKGDLKTHCQLDHERLEEVHNMYKCNQCNYETVNRKHLNTHLLWHKYNLFDVKIHKCNHCNFETVHKGTLKNHLRLHKHPDEVVRYKCKECDHQTIHKNNLKTQLRRHKHPEEVEVYMCNKCSYQTVWKNSLTRHILRHR